MAKHKKVRLDSLSTGEYAITEVGSMGIMIVSERSFSPYFPDSCRAVNLANGIGGFLPRDKAYPCKREEAFAAASR